ncbi:hypothetical protein AB4156_22135 [Cupriavidus sp. 2MCAB6]|uniref:hypothetical protein n=1 Tax=Cupriavidus sp. 2MCAB6 TaxID=3232981 RepID=UPI003F90699D
MEIKLDRGIKDEGFVSRALEIADHGCGRWVANQSCFNHPARHPLEPMVKAAIVTAVAIYVEKFRWPEEELASALAIVTVGDAQVLIDRLFPNIPKP